MIASGTGIVASSDEGQGDTIGVGKTFQGWLAFLPAVPSIEAEPIFGWTRKEVKDELALRETYGDDITRFVIRKVQMTAMAPLSRGDEARIERHRHNEREARRAQGAAV